MYTIAENSAALFRIAGKDATEQDRVITGSISTSDTTRSFIGKVASQTNQYYLKSRLGTTAPGTFAPVDVTVNAIDTAGNPLAPQVFNFQIQGPALPPPATHVVISEGPITVDGSYPTTDPGSATIPL